MVKNGEEGKVTILYRTLDDRGELVVDGVAEWR
jgi:hypothetical protein